MSQRKLLSNEAQSLKDTMNADYQNVSIRLREGEYQYDLVKAIAAFHLELLLPDVQDIIRKLYGEDKAGDLQFVRKIQTILKKMEKGDVVRILPKNRPWELQKYALSSFKFRDSDKNMVSFASDEEIARALEGLSTLSSVQRAVRVSYVKLALIVSIMALSYVAILWSLTQPVVNPAVFVPSLAVSVFGSIALGRMLSQE